MVSIVGIILLVVIFLGLTALYYNFANSEVAERVIGRATVEVDELNAAQHARIEGSPHWESRQVEGADEGVMDDHLIIPIDRAMQLVVDENK